MISPLHDKLDQVEWGEYKLGDLFESSNGNFDIQKNHINGLGEYVITAGLTENGIMGRSDVEAKIFDKNTITIDMFGDIFFRQFTYKMVTHARVFSLKSKVEITENQGLFLSSSLHFLKKLYGYENMCSWAKIQNEKIQLPTKNGQIDFDFIEEFIAELEAERLAELEAERLAELEAYLSTTGLRDYHLTESESHILSEFESGKFAWGEFRISELFNVIGTKSLDSNAIDFVDKGINFVGRTYTDNGVQGKIEKQTFEPNEPFTITATVIGNYKYVKFQTEPYYCSQNIDKLTPNSSISQRNKKIAYYFITNIQKFVSLYDGQQGGYKLEDIKKYTMIIPTYNSQPNYEMMETFISAIQKLVIRDVVLYADRKIAATKTAIEK